MAKFNLTFKGKVSPERDLAQVKTGLADILSIADPNTIEGFFGGKTVVLRSNLARKAAAEYFMKLRELGAEVELVTAIDISGKSTIDIEHNTGIDTHKPGNRPPMAEVRQEQDGIIDQSWPVSGARTKPKPANTGKLRKPSATHPSAKGPPTENRTKLHKRAQPSILADESSLVSSQISAKMDVGENDIKARAQPKRQQQDRRARRKNQLIKVEKAAALELSRLENQIVSIEDKTRLETSQLLKTEDELRAGVLQSRAKLEQGLLEVQEKEKRELQKLNSLKAVTQQDCDSLRTKLLQEQQEQEQRLGLELQRVQKTGQNFQRKVTREIAKLRQKQEQTRVSLDEDLAKLEKLMEATRQQASKDLTELETLASEQMLKLEDEESGLRRQEAEIKQAFQLASAARNERKSKAEAEHDKELARLNHLQKTATQQCRQRIRDMQEQVALSISEKNREIDHLRELRDSARRQAKREQSHLHGLQKMVEQRKLAQLEKLKARTIKLGNKLSSAGSPGE